jgi:hypothetical protein
MDQSQNQNLELALEGLVQKPLHKMSDEELRSFVVRMTELRDSSQSRTAYFQGQKSKKEDDIFDEL